MRDLLTFALMLWLGGLVLSSALAADYQATPENYRQFLPRLQAGDRLMLGAGTYRQGLPLKNLAGEPGRPIVVEGPPVSAPEGPARFLARQGANTISLVDVQHIVLRNLELDGGNLPVDAIKAEGHGRFAHFVTLEGLYIHDHGASQQNVGISTKCPVLLFRIFGLIFRQ